MLILSHPGLQSFKRLLDDIVFGEGDRSAQREILRQYLEAVKPRQTGEDAVFLTDIMEMWSFASQVTDLGVMSSAAVVLALVMQAVSGSLSLVSHGLGICQTLVQEQQLKSISKNLSSEKSKAFILSPTLRLLKEAVCLDGGAFARHIFRVRQYTFTSLGRNLEIGSTNEGEEDTRKTPVRTNAVRFFLSCLKYLHSDGRKELLTQKELFSHLTFMIKNDPPQLVLEILHGLKTHVLMDAKISREIKSRSFNTKTLLRILALYTYNTGDEEQCAAVSGKAHDILVYACTSPTAGLVFPSTGLYPKPTDEEGFGKRGKVASTKADSPEDIYTKGIPVYNFILSEFVQKLRPWSNLKHNELLVAIFESSPELIADYFFNNRSFTFEPKLTMTWIGYSTFLFKTMQLPLPSHFGDRTRYAHGPAPTSILLDNIIPLPINQKVLMRCFSSQSNLISLFATRILVVALEKLSTALKMHEGPSRTGSPKWEDASRRLIDSFCQRIPDMKDVVRMYRSVPAENFLYKTLASRLLRLYYEIIPRVALAANFDVSPLFVNVLKTIDGETGATASEAKAFGVMELENLVSIASYSPGMRWFAKVDGLVKGASSSPFTALLRLLCADNGNTPSKQLRRALATVAVENQLVPAQGGLVPLLQALDCSRGLKDVPSIDFVWSFLDNCINRCATSPIKYLESLTDLASQALFEEKDAALSLLSMTIAEQLSYALASAEKPEKASLARWLSLYFNAVNMSTDDSELLKALYGKVREQLSGQGLRVKDLGSKAEVEMIKSSSVEADEKETSASYDADTSPTVTAAKLEELLHTPRPSDEDTSALLKWSSKSVEDLVEDGHAANLIRLLGSPHTSIRKEALTNILKMAAKIKESSYEEKDQVWLLLYEVAESSRPHVDAGPAPSSLTAFAAHAVEVIRNPLHPLYPKVNAFLTKSPVWGADKVPLAHDVLHGQPSEDDRYYTEVAWLLTYLVDALATPRDLSVLHRKRWFEKVLVLGANPYLRWNLRQRILRILYRATCVDGGSTTLVTRFGVLAWLDEQRAGCEVQEERAVYEALMRRFWETCDQERIQVWSKGGAGVLIDSIPSA